MSFTLEYLEQVPYELLDDPVDDQASPEELTARIGKYMVMESLKLPFTTDAKIKIARGEINGRKDFKAAVNKVWTQRYKDGRGIELAELETEAEFLGVFEDIWPPDPISEAEAELAEAQLAA